YAEIMAGLVAAILSALINGPIIIQTLLQGGAEGGAGAGEPLSPPETPIPDPPGEDTQKDGMAILRKQKQDWEAAEAAKKAAENKKLLENLQHMQRQIVSGPHGDLYRPGEAGDLNKQINTAINQTIFGKDVNKDLYNQIYQIYKGRNLSVGRTIPESQMISDSGIRRDTIVGTLEPTGNEIFTGRDANGNFSSKSLALRFLAGIGTLGSSELVATPVSSLYTMKSYVDGGGSSVLGGFSEAMKDVAIGEGIGLGISGLSAVGGKIVGALANELPTSISEPIKDGIEDLKNVLNTDVKDLFTTKTSGGLAGTNPHVKTSAEITEQFLKGKELGEISPGLKDYAIVPGIDPPDLSCFSDNARKAIRLAADRSLADIHFKASNPDSGIKLANGEAIPKWSEIKVTTVKEGDLPLGYSEDHKGLVVYKQPETPVKTAGMSEGEWQAANKQYDYKLKEFNDQGPAIAELQAQGKINVDPDTGLITSTKHNKPFASDNDAYCYTKPGTHETVSKFVEAKINQDLQGFGVIEHPNHTAWNYSNASNSAMNKLVPIDSKALTGSKLGVEGAIPLNTYRPLEGTWGTSWYNGPTVRSWVQGMLQQ
ncbi:MAG: hypothetical protein WCP36_08905, partial [Methanomicrobiales archaeon]